MFVQYSFVGHTRESAMPARTPLQISESLVSLIGVASMLLTAGAYVLA